MWCVPAKVATSPTRAGFAWHPARTASLERRPNTERTSLTKEK